MSSQTLFTLLRNQDTELSLRNVLEMRKYLGPEQIIGQSQADLRE